MKPSVLRRAEDFDFRALLSQAWKEGDCEVQDLLLPLPDGKEGAYPEPPASAPGCGLSRAGDGAIPSTSAGLQLCLRTTGAGGPPAEEEGLAARPL